MKKYCKWCGKKYTVTSSKRNSMFCSLKCVGLANRRRVTKKCEYCGKEFESTFASGRRFCSKKCDDLRRRKSVVNVCENCGKEYTVKKSIGKIRRFCSKKCASDYRKKRVTRVCENCGCKYDVAFRNKNSKFCSIECLGLSRRKYEIRKCLECGKSFIVSSWSKKILCSHMCSSKMKENRVEKRCEFCGGRYIVPASESDGSKFCSIECQGRAKRKVQNWPTSDELNELLYRMTMEEIGKVYGVTPNAVRYWAKKYKLKWPGKLERRRIQRMLKAGGD